MGDLPARPQMGVPLPTDQSGVVTFYGYEVLAADAVAIRKGNLESIIWFAIYFLAFFGPLATLWLREPWRSGVLFCLAIPSLYALGLITFFATPLYGGVIAVACWIVLLVLSSATLRVSFRNRKARATQT